MKRFLKWMLILILSLIGLALLGVASLYVYTESQINTEIEVPEESIQIPPFSADELTGWDHAMITFCQECHGANLAGQIMEDDPMVGTLVSANLTPGAGGIGSEFTDEDWVRAIRHGVGPDNKSLMVMPSENFYTLSDEDLGQIIAYMKELPPVDNILPETKLGPMGRFFMLQEPFLTGAMIEHYRQRPPSPEPGVTAEYGGYLANIVCTFCHGEDLAGGETPSAGLNLTPGGDLANWTEADFLKTIRTGVKPSGKVMDNEEMPWENISVLDDDELRAIWLYLQSLPPVENQMVSQEE